MTLQEGAGGDEYWICFLSTEIGEGDKNNKNPQAITLNNYLAAQNVLKTAEKYKVEGGRKRLISHYRKKAKLALLSYQQELSDTSLFWKLLLQTALPNIEWLKHLLPLLPLSLQKHWASYILFRVSWIFFALSYTKIFIFEEKVPQNSISERIIAPATIKLQ